MVLVIHWQDIQFIKGRNCLENPANVSVALQSCRSEKGRRFLIQASSVPGFHHVKLL
ncbi:hypothetical protein E2C01_009165 [Portunus trituberculatus]|uniref:Uncharacterized protein n=1 Tax=Portunus trituberculatus TaxID=210409 RepID=A0A5B7D2R5_PORTR|nr:hypothetical protein [Portunus trituberculatus]